MSTIEFICLHEEYNIVYNKQINGYIVGDNKYLIVECKQEDLYDCISMIDLQEFCGSKVICIDGIATVEQQKMALQLKVEIIDKSVIEEIRENIDTLIEGVNIPAIGYGTYKMHMINSIKNQLK